MCSWGLLGCGAALLLWQFQYVASRSVLAAAMGLNNCITVYRPDLQLPLTHMTGAMVGNIAGAVRGTLNAERDYDMLKIYAALLGGFVLGCVLGCVLGAALSVQPLMVLVPSVVYMVLSFGHCALLWLRRLERAKAKAEKRARAEP